MDTDFSCPPPVPAPMPGGRDPRAVDARGPPAGQRVPMSSGMPGPAPHSMQAAAPPSSRQVQHSAALV